MSEATPTRPVVEWVTLALIVAGYALWLGGLFWLTPVSTGASVVLTGVLVAFHASLTHEVLHGHPFRSRTLSEATMVLPLNLLIPYNRFRDTHLAHHRDANLTDPYDDPESNYLDPAIWDQLPRALRALLRFNNTLLGRVTVGAAIGMTYFLRDEWRGAVRGDRAIWLAWALHLPGAAMVLALVWWSPMPVWAYLISAYIGLSILRIRTFLEHRAHEKVRARTVVIEDRGVLAFMFLNKPACGASHESNRALVSIADALSGGQGAISGDQ